MREFYALRIHRESGKIKPQVQKISLDDLTDGEVVLRVHYSSVNYKDALAGSGKGKILKRYPLNGGIDAAGEIVTSQDSRFRTGEKVLVTGCGIGEIDDGGFSEILRVKADSVIALPQGLTLKESMILGTAGFTAALALHRMLENHQHPEKGPILVTGATGGVGSFAIQLFSQQGFETHALTGKTTSLDYLKSLGAHQILNRDQLELGDRPLENARFGGAVDNVGGKLLAQILAHTQLWGNVCSIGLAESSELSTTVMPFILRGVSLLGVSSNNCPLKLRQKIWQNLAGPWKPKKLEGLISRSVALSELPKAFDDLLERRIQGRILVDLTQPVQ